MRTFSTHFDDLHTMDTVYGAMSFKPDQTIIQVLSGLEFMEEHPAYAIYGKRCPKAQIIFNHVSSYELTICQYLKTPEEGGFGPTQVESKQWSATGDSTEFYLEGVKLEAPACWLTLEIQAKSAELQVLE